MKKVIYFICYVIATLIGVSLLIFNYETLDRDQSMLRYTMVAAGVIFIIPAIIQLISSLIPKKDEHGNILPKKWYTTVVAILALLWGIYILLFPLGYNNEFNYTLGISLILIGFAQAAWIIRTSESTFLRFIVPVVAVVLGVLIFTIFNHTPDAGKSAQIGAILSGIMIVIWGINGFLSLRSKRVVAAADKAAHIERKNVKEERKAEKEARKEAEKEAKEASEYSSETAETHSAEPSADVNISESEKTDKSEETSKESEVAEKENNN